MRYRRFGRLGWLVSEVGYGMWGIAGGEGGWTGGDDATGTAALQEAADLGCNFFDTAWIYGRGHSEEMLSALLAANAGRLYAATKIPPLDRAWPSTRTSRLSDVYPAEHIVEYTRKSRANLGVDQIDLLQFHVWEDSWADDKAWQRPIADLKRQGVINGVGISINRWEPWNVLKTLDTGLIDAVQVVYNIFDQAPEDELFPACQARDIAIIARVPFDEGMLTGTITEDSRWPDGDWRNSYFVPENLRESVPRAALVAELVPSGMTLPELGLKFILHHPSVTTVIPGMRNGGHVRSNLAVSDGEVLPTSLLSRLRTHRWDRKPTWWSQLCDLGLPLVPAAAETSLARGDRRGFDAVQHDAAAVYLDLYPPVRGARQDVGGRPGSQRAPVVNASLIDRRAENGGQAPHQRGCWLVETSLVEESEAPSQQLKPRCLVHAAAFGAVDPVLHDADRRDPAAAAESAGQRDRLDRGDRDAADTDWPPVAELNGEGLRLGGRLLWPGRHQRGHVPHGRNAERLELEAFVRAAAQVAVHRIPGQAGHLRGESDRAEVPCHAGPVGEAVEHPVSGPGLEHAEPRRELGRIPRETTLVVAPADAPVGEHGTAVRAQGLRQASDEDLAGRTGGVPVTALVDGLVRDEIEAPSGHQVPQVDQPCLQTVGVEQLGDTPWRQVARLADVGDVARDSHPAITQVSSHRHAGQAARHKQPDALIHQICEIHKYPTLDFDANISPTKRII